MRVTGEYPAFRHELCVVTFELLYGIQKNLDWLQNRTTQTRQVPRFMTKTCLLDYDSIAGADKFGNMFVLRVPADVSDDVDNPTGLLQYCVVLHSPNLCFVYTARIKPFLVSCRPFPPFPLLSHGECRKPAPVGLWALERGAEQG